jgi:beta-glucosidase
MTSQLTFPTGFTWGTATASYQIEGAASDDGRRPGIWDTFSRVPGKVDGGDTGDIACDHYHRLEQDLDLLSSLGIHSYRFSVSWPRVLSDDTAQPNKKGLDFYERLVDGLLERDISPLLTLYHWDLPQWREDAGGWLDRNTVDRFVDLAVLIGRTLGDRVETVTTLNEPWCSAFLGYGSGEHAPGRTDNASALMAAHHLNLAHGRAVTALRSVLPKSARLSVSLNLAHVEPASDSADDLAAARHVDAVANRIFLEPMLRGRYPEHLMEDLEHITDWAFVRDSDLAEIAAPIDILGINYYSPSRVAAVATDTAYTASSARALSGPARWPGTDRAVSVARPGPVTGMGWAVAPETLTSLLLGVHRDYPEVPLMVTENGCCYEDKLGGDGAVHDEERIRYLRDHLAAVHTAIDAGVNVHGYYLWSFMDNFEWAWGYSKRFGIVYVDYKTQKRVPKDSGLWYRGVIHANGVDIES